MAAQPENLRAGVVVTGTEVLAGRTKDRNGPWVSERLGDIGVEVAHILCVGDRPADLLSALRFMDSEGLDLVVTSGGLGPTADDLTAEVVGEFAGREMILDEEMEAKIAEIIAGFARRFNFEPEALKAANRKQATVPEGAAAIDPAGTAPGLVVPAERLLVIVLPGPPRELQAMWPLALQTEPARALLDRVEPFESASLRLFALPESEIAATLREAGSQQDLSGLEITTCLRRAELEVDIRFRQPAREAADFVVEMIREKHATNLFSDDGTTLDDQLAELLQGHTIGLAESCTGGLLAARLTERPGASAYVAGGVVSYSNASKTELLGVVPELIDQHGAVSPEVAEAMADGALTRFGADMAVAVTGVAGPDGGTEEKPVGYVCICVKSATGTKLARDPVLPGDRNEIRERSATVALHILRRLLRGEDLPL